MHKTWPDQNVELLVGDCRETLKEIPDESVQCVISSPPYLGLRDYGTSQWEGGNPDCDHAKEIEACARRAVGVQVEKNKVLQQVNAKKALWKDCPVCGATRIDNQIGNEDTPQEYVDNILTVFSQVYRVLRNDGVVWLNLGDSYAGSGEGGGGNKKNNEHGQHDLMKGKRPKVSGDLKPKDLVGIPWMVAFALRKQGWYLRQDIIWAKGVSGQKQIWDKVYNSCINHGVDIEVAKTIADDTDPFVGNPVPESVRDRCAKSHEYVFLLTKSPKYFFNSAAIKEEAQWERWGEHTSIKYNNTNTSTGWMLSKSKEELEEKRRDGRNRRSVWQIPTKPYKEAHFACFPPDLVEPCILAGTSSKGCCPDCKSPWEYIEHTISNTKGWKPTCKCYPRHEEWQNIPRIKSDEDKTQYLNRIQDIINHNVELLDFWKNMETTLCTVLDMFGGSGTVADVGYKHNCFTILCELNEEYVQLIYKRAIENNQSLWDVLN